MPRKLIKGIQGRKVQGLNERERTTLFPFRRLSVLRELMVFGLGLCWVGSGFTYLQLGQDGDDLQSMTRR
ncbi:hypothetical protein C5167_030667 [Papaver somniferum]|nr:hypothetical protein C5167_030667 [Papaver somniferum]